MTEEFIIELAVTNICEKGCKHVYLCIDELKKNNGFEEIKHLSLGQSQKVLIELESLMSIYDGEFCSTSQE